MPHGLPDWGLAGPKTTTFGLDDLGEHAVRLGSPVLWDRRGDQVFATDFRNGIGDMEYGSDGLLADVVLQTGSARQGAFCVKLTAGSNLLRLAYIRKRLPFLVLGKVGFEVSFAYDLETDYFELYVYLHDGAGRWEPGMRLYPNTGALWVSTELPAGWVQVPGVANVHQSIFCNNTIKMVFDATRVLAPYIGYYERAIVNSIEYDLTPYPIDYTGGAATPQANFSFQHYGTLNNNPVAYADCFIVTQNEP